MGNIKVSYSRTEHLRFNFFSLPSLSRSKKQIVVSLRDLARILSRNQIKGGKKIPYPPVFFFSTLYWLCSPSFILLFFIHYLSLTIHYSTCRRYSELSGKYFMEYKCILKNENSCLTLQYSFIWVIAFSMAYQHKMGDVSNTKWFWSLQGNLDTWHNILHLALRG